MSEEEVEDRKEFIGCYMLKEFELILQIPIQPRENDFWFSSYQEFMESAFDTHDYQKPGVLLTSTGENHGRSQRAGNPPLQH